MKKMKNLKWIAGVLFMLAMLVIPGKAEASEGLHYLTSYQYGGESKVYTGDPTKYFTMMGTKYYYGVAADGLYVDRDFYFNLDRKFTKVTFDLGNVDFGGKLRGNPGNALIYLDGQLVKEIPVSAGMITEKVTLDTEGKKQLIVDFSTPGNTNHDSYYGLGNVVGYGGHFYTVENTIPATPKKEGLRTYFCDACGDSYEETVAPLKECKPYLSPYNVSENLTVFNGGDNGFYAMGVKYNYGVNPRKWYDNRVVLYNLGQQYNSVTFDLGWTGAGTVYTDPATVKIYGDNILLKTINATANMYDQTITLRTPSITQLKIELGGANTQYGIFNMTYDVKEAKEHDFSSQVILEATKTSTGIMSYTCADCALSYTEVIPKIVEKKFTINFKANGGTKLSKSKMTVKEGKSLGKLPTVVRKGYYFKGWYTKSKDGLKISSSTKPKSNKTYYAQWTKVLKPDKVKSVKATNSSSKKAKITYKKVSKAKGYQITYSTSSSFKNAKKITTTSTSKTLTGLTKGKTYYVKVRAYKQDSAKNKIYGYYK